MANTSKLGGRNSNNGSKAHRQRVVVDDGQLVNANSIIIMNTQSLRAKENTYQSSNNIHAKVSGRVRIKDKRVSVVKQDNFEVLEEVWKGLPEVSEKEIEKDLDKAISKGREE